MAKPTGFLSLGKPTALADSLVQDNQRVASYQTVQRGVDTRSGNIIRSDARGYRRILVGVKSSGSPIVAISIDDIDVVNALEA